MIKTLEDAIEWLRGQPKCPHDGTTSPCALCLIREAQTKATKGNVRCDCCEGATGFGPYEPPKEGER